MREPIHTFICLEINGSVVFSNVPKIVFLYDLLWYVGDVETDEFGSCKRGVEVKVGDVHGHEFCTPRRYGTVEKYFGNEHVGCRGRDFAGVVDSVPPYYKACSIGFLLLWPDCAHEGTVSDVFASSSGDSRLWDECDRVGAMYPAPYTISEATKFIGGR